MPILPALFWSLIRSVVTVLAFWPARVARRKGRSATGFFVLGVLCLPLALVLVYTVADRTRQTDAQLLGSGP